MYNAIGVSLAKSKIVSLGFKRKKFHQLQNRRLLHFNNYTSEVHVNKGVNIVSLVDLSLPLPSNPLN